MPFKSRFYSDISSKWYFLSFSSIVDKKLPSSDAFELLFSNQPEHLFPILPLSWMDALCFLCLFSANFLFVWSFPALPLYLSINGVSVFQLFSPNPAFTPSGKVTKALVCLGSGAAWVSVLLSTGSVSF